jgi:hypothetical protein
MEVLVVIFPVASYRNSVGSDGKRVDYCSAALVDVSD